MTESEINALLSQLKIEFESKYKFIQATLKLQKKLIIYSLDVTIKCGRNRNYYTFRFTNNANVVTLRRHLYNVVNKIGEEYVRGQKRIPKKSTSTV